MASRFSGTRKKSISSRGTRNDAAARLPQWTEPDPEVVSRQDLGTPRGVPITSKNEAEHESEVVGCARGSPMSPHAHRNHLPDELETDRPGISGMIRRVLENRGTVVQVVYCETGRSVTEVTTEVVANVFQVAVPASEEPDALSPLDLRGGIKRRLRGHEGDVRVENGQRFRELTQSRDRPTDEVETTQLDTASVEWWNSFLPGCGGLDTEVLEEHAHPGYACIEVGTRPEDRGQPFDENSVLEPQIVAT